MPIFPKSLLFLSLLLLSSTPSQSFFCNYPTALFSLSHSLISRVPALRTGRGDVEGAAQARALVNNLERVYALIMVLDNMKNYGRKDSTSFRDLYAVVTDLNLLGDEGPLRDIESLQKEVMDGNLLRDLIELVAGDLKSCKNCFSLFIPLLSLQKEVVDGNLLREKAAGDLKSCTKCFSIVIPPLLNIHSSASQYPLVAGDLKSCKNCFSSFIHLLSLQKEVVDGNLLREKAAGDLKSCTKCFSIFIPLLRLF